MKSTESWRSSKWDRIAALSALICAVCAIVSVLAALRSCQTVRVLNEPYVVVSPLQYDDTDSYIKTERHGDAVRLWIRYNVINRGNVPVRDLRMPKKLIVRGALPGTSQAFHAEFPDELTLGPGQSYKHTLETQIRSSTKTGQELENEIREGKMTVIVRLILTYFAEVPDRKEYKVMSEDEFSYGHVTWLKSEFID